MKIRVELLGGPSFELQVEPDDTIFMVKEKIMPLFVIPFDVQVQHLIFRGITHPLADEHTLEYYSIKDGSTVHLVDRRAGSFHGDDEHKLKK